MGAQEDGLRALGTICREIVPPQLDFVVLVYMPEGGLGDVSHVLSTTLEKGKERAAEAARVFALKHGGPTKPNN